MVLDQCAIDRQVLCQQSQPALICGVGSLRVSFGVNENIIDNIIELIMTGFQPLSCIGLDKFQLRVIKLEIVLRQLNVT